MYSRAYLESLKMKELREIGKEMEAYDTSKAELIDEILVKQPRPKESTETEKLIADLERTERDFVQTYELRPRIIEMLKKLEETEKKEG